MTPRSIWATFDAVTLAPGEPAALLSAADDPHASTRWALRELEVPEGYTAALAVEGHDWALKCFGEARPK